MGSSIKNRLKLKTVEGREASLNSMPKVHPSACHGLDQSGNTMQCERPAKRTKLAHMIEAGSGNGVDLISESKATIQNNSQVTSGSGKLNVGESKMKRGCKSYRSYPAGGNHIAT